MDIREAIDMLRDYDSGNMEALEEVLDTAEYYTDLDEAGKLMVLPCAEGDTVWIVKNNTSACMKCEHFFSEYADWTECQKENSRIDFPNFSEKPACEKQFWDLEEATPKLTWIVEHLNDFGKTVFMKKEDAARALQRLYDER